MRWAIALAVILVASAGVARAATSPWASLAEPAFVRVDTRELPESVVAALAQDRAGFLWVGTQGGLGRYDGYHFKNYLPNPGDPNALPDGYIRTLLANDSNGLWIGTDSAGLARFDATTDTFHTWRPDPHGKHGPRSGTVYVLESAGGGAIWIGGDAGIDRYDPATGVFTPLLLGTPQSRGRSVRAILTDRAGRVWIAADNGLYRRDNASSAPQRVSLGPAERTASEHIRSLYEDSAGRIWAGGLNSLYGFDRRGTLARTFRSSPSDVTSLNEGVEVSIVEPKRGTLWVGSSDAGFSVIETATGRIRRIHSDPRLNVGLPAGRVWQFLRDRSGLIWVANYSGGLLLYNPFAQGMYVLSPSRFGMGETGADTLSMIGGRLWIGGSRGVLVGIEPGEPTIHHVILGGSNVFGLSAGLRGQLWIGLNDRLCVLPAPLAAVDCTQQPKGADGPLLEWTVLDTPSARWYGTGSGVYLEDKRTGAVRIFRQGHGPYDLSSDLAGVIYRDRAGFIWVGTGNGLNRIDPRTYRVAQFTFDPRSTNSFGPGSIENILQTRDGRLWVGLNGGPLNVIEHPDGEPQFRRLDRADGLPHQNVDGLKQDASGAVWASTDAGIARIDPVTMHVRAFGVADGILGANYWGGAVVQAPDGTIFFGSDQGLSVIAPGAKSPWNYDPAIVLTSLKIADRPVPLATSVQLQPGNRDITAEFAALDYSAPQQLQYQYMLEGYDHDWLPTDTLHRIATYTNLPPGQYTLRVRATNRLGVWSTHDLAVTIEALPAWYETWWFRLLAIAAVLLLAFGLIQLRTVSLSRRAQELEALVRDRTKALEEASVSDPLTGLKNRRFVMQTAGQDAAWALRDGVDLLFFMIDVDYFKDVNDTYGHDAGDRVLVQMRERLQHVFRDADHLVRWGGEEFLAIARGSSRRDAPEIAERIRIEVERRPFSIGEGRTVRRTVSIGFAAFPFVPSQPNAVDWQRVINFADRALYAAKQAGRNTWRGLGAGPTGSQEIVQPQPAAQTP